VADDIDKLESCLPSCFKTSLVFDSLGEDMFVVVMEDEMEVAARDDDVAFSAGRCDRQAGQLLRGGGVSPNFQLSD